MNWREQCQKILNTEYSDKLDELYSLGGTSGGARPKDHDKVQRRGVDHQISGNMWMAKILGEWSMSIRFVPENVELL